MKLSNKNRYYLTVLKLGVIVLTPVVLLLLPKTFFNNGEAICLSRLLFQTECPACGMTRACMHLIHLDFEEAYAYNMMSFVVLPLLAVVWVQWFLKEWKVFGTLRQARLA